jgi:hypothetical protein
MTSAAYEHEIATLLAHDPELLAIADAIAATQAAPRRRNRRRLALALAAALAVVAVAGPALGLHRTIVSFFEAEPAPERAQIDFARMGLGAPAPLGPDVVHEQARKVLERELEGKVRALYVAPTARGGFCWTWSEMTSSCGRTNDRQSPLGFGWREGPNGATSVTGHVFGDTIDRLELRYEDGRADDVPIVWISPPIDAGLYGFDVPDEQLREGRRPQALVAMSADGDVVARHGFHYSDPDWESGRDGLPRIADRSRLRTLFEFTARNGTPWELRVAPAPGDKLCYAYNGGGGCRSPKFPGSLLNLGVQGGSSIVVLCCEAGERTAAVELRYEDGDSLRLDTVDGFLLYEVPPEHHALGHRLTELVGYDATGRELERRSLEPSRGVYPCRDEDELDLGFGLSICP